MNSALLSKINWTQIIGFLASVLAIWGFNVPAELQAQLVIAVQAITAVATIIFRTWFTTPTA